ncbi:MAG: phosphoglucomutase/phosphomannomutase family protein [Candidatus Omnitrophica bacterium]|nr:phosphoglucomutase/phosphomannomutase family protein [Candidatus Omnitrophota bacterium]MDE2008541.1 phosphoglucomutase/phosphomannomutase family protein [Candidatus Omnitrophota bacterium]MDE2214007.1 phosphoglucomutase/phosphomannomutase family protein [Candidatus Omnitrophota bacterium]MDE2231338.1 phosphoglucomutase/phosphomannomutase family protein [Candidatus Omnitrophota bacterium]
MSDIKTQIKFGTDGWRAVISDTFTFENVRIVAQAAADWVNKNNSQFAMKSASVGYDNRFLSAEYAQAVAEVFAANGIKTWLSDTSLPTPALSFGVVGFKNVCGIMITASHNPAKFNGIKIKTSQGGAASKDITNAIEGYLGQTPFKRLGLSEAVDQGLIVVHDFKAAYVKFLRGYINLRKMKTAKYKVLSDIMHGSGRDLMRRILKGTDIKLTLMREDVNPSFDGSKPEPIPECLQVMMGRMKNEKFDFGHVLDGDADRIAAVMPGGEFVSPQKILGLLILHLVRNRHVQGGIVKTLCGTTMLDHIAQKLGRKLYETPVGFKYISDLMVSEKIVAGGEEAGGMGLPGYIPERDGTLSGLLLLEMMVYNKKNFKQLVDDMEKEFGRYYYTRLDYAMDAKKVDLNKLKTISSVLGKKVVEVKDFDGVKLICENEDWLMFRPSGTEPLVRIYAEAKSLKRSKDILEFGRQQVDPKSFL